MFDSIGKAFVLSLKAVKIFCVIIVLNLAMNVVNLMIIPAPVDAEMNLQKSLAVIGMGLLFFLLAVFVQGGVIAYVRDLVKSGSASLAPFIANCAKYFVRMLGIALLTMLIVLGWGVLLFAILPVFLPALKAVSLILGIIVLIGLMILLILPGYVLVGSDLSVMGALKKGASVAANNFLKMLVILIVLIIVSIVVMFLASFLTGLLSIVLKQLVSYVAAIAMAISSAVITILANIAYMDFYLKRS
ncbi:MAG: hypothetical protein KKD29_06935 [Candidatus Omnitrophica bacterium]|nr:hypothetical protein [Candidatus Omnitrophota bacterium]MBU4488793.1 hypothetical protein [Candidatus Omnitrophota bacterium]MCG2705450.1 hypothetical protein [Candidatus Omnitrophota bacterium]